MQTREMDQKEVEATIEERVIQLTAENVALLKKVGNLEDRVSYLQVQREALQDDVSRLRGDVNLLLRELRQREERETGRERQSQDESAFSMTRRRLF